MGTFQRAWFGKAQWTILIIDMIAQPVTNPMPVQRTNKTAHNLSRACRLTGRLELGGGAGYAVANGRRATRFMCTRQQAFQEVEKSVQAVHDLGALGVAGQEAGAG